LQPSRPRLLSIHPANAKNFRTVSIFRGVEENPAAEVPA
jgi:hypothetical protein